MQQKLADVERKGGSLCVRLKEGSAFDPYIYEQIRMDETCLPPLQERKGVIRYETAGLTSLSYFLAHYHFEQEEAYRFIIQLLEQLLKANRKMYIVDLGLRNHILPRKNYDLGFSLENMVYFELLRRGYKVTIGRVGNTEVDFVAEKQGAYEYFQVTADMRAKETFDREIRPLENIRDNYEKTILTMDRLTPGNYNGIQVRYLLDWLIGTKN